MVQRDAAPVILKMPASLVGSPVLRRSAAAAAIPDREPTAAPPLPPGWWERWLVPVGELVVPVEFYASAVPAEPPRHLESRTIACGRVVAQPYYLGVRFGRARRED